MDSTSPFSNCEFTHCDLVGQCVSEGKCHHPKKLTIQDLQARDAEIEALKAQLAERDALIAQKDSMKLTHEQLNTPFYATLKDSEND